MEWTRARISPTHPRVARRVAGTARAGRVRAGPWQPPRAALGVHRLGTDRPGEPRAADDADRALRPHPPADGLRREGRRRRTDRAGRRLDALARGPAGARESRAASASPATASRRPATWSSTPTASGARGIGPRTTSRRSRARCAPPVSRIDSSSGCRTACDASMIGGRRPIQGRKLGDKRIRVERPHSAYFRWTGPGQLTAKESASGPTTPTGRAFARVRGRPARPAAGVRGGDRRAAVEEEGPRDLQLRRDQLVGLRDRGDPAGADRRRRRGACVRPRDQHRDRDPPDRRRDQLPPDLHRLSDRRRQLLGLQAELRAAHVADRGVGAADRLRVDRCRVDVVGHRAGHLRVPGPVRRAGHPRRRRDRPDHDRQPPRDPRSRQHLRRPDLPLRLLGPADDRDRDRSGSSSSARASSPRSSARRAAPSSPSGSSSSCAPSRPARSPSPGPRRSPPACPRSSRRSRRTPRRPWP